MPTKPSAGSSYTRIPVRGSGRSFCSLLFGRQHKSKASEEALVAGRTLFVANVPHVATTEGLQAAFSALGDVTHVQLGSLGDGEAGGLSVRTAHVVFAQARPLRSCRSLPNVTPNAVCVSPFPKQCAALPQGSRRRACCQRPFAAPWRVLRRRAR